jgi:hypothetical protein
MSTANIIQIVPVFERFEIFGEVPIPVAVDITFKCHGGDRTYRWTAPEAIVGILGGDDPAGWPGGERIG